VQSSGTFILKSLGESIQDARRTAALSQTLWKKAAHAMNNHTINIARAINAAKITSRLNIRIRRSYACVQLISPALSEVRFAAPINPLAFTCPLFIRLKNQTQQKCFPAGKHIYHQS
jgi:hypothetical protein